MIHPRTLLAGCALAICAMPLPAQVQKGTAAPKFTFDRVWNDGPADWSELEGKLVILDFAQTW